MIGILRKSEQMPRLMPGAMGVTQAWGAYDLGAIGTSGRRRRLIAEFESWRQLRQLRWSQLSLSPAWPFDILLTGFKCCIENFQWQQLLPYSICYRPIQVSLLNVNLQIVGKVDIG